MIRVSGGEHRGRALRTPPGEATRPTSSRVREAIFSIIGPINGASVLDLFCGSGALGIEALSRGAQTATFVDDAPAATDAVTANLRTLGLEGRGSVERLSARKAVSRSIARDARYDLVLCDAPYREAPRLLGQLVDELPQLIAPGGGVLLELDRRSTVELPLELAREKRYGDTLVRWYRAN
jgi:16S rRNA (guanine966-N2)-methyltransferase